MAKLALISVLIVTLAGPIYFSKSRRAAAGVRSVVVSFALFVCAWTAYMTYVYTDAIGPVDLHPLTSKRGGK